MVEFYKRLSIIKNIKKLVKSDTQEIPNPSLNPNILLNNEDLTVDQLINFLKKGNTPKNKLDRSSSS